MGINLKMFFLINSSKLFFASNFKYNLSLLWGKGRLIFFSKSVYILGTVLLLRNILKSEIFPKYVL